MESSQVDSAQPNYTLVDDIKIYDGTTDLSCAEYTLRNNYLKTLTKGVGLFSPLQPSTLTAQGYMSNVSFDEKNIIDMLSPPTEHILMIGCNYGEKFNPKYKPPEVRKTSGRGRKPKPKVKSRRKVQGNGKYFSSQITFLIEHPDKPANQYKIKLFRNGVFQVPGIRNPDMKDLVKPIKILRDYLKYNFAEDVQVMNFMAVMRNYKSSLVNKYYHVHLEKLEEIIFREKVNPLYRSFIDFMTRGYSTKHKNKIKDALGTYNPINIAEMTYNTDRCFCLIIKFYRPSLLDPKKKTTVKLLKKGKINFDGGNSQQEVEELYNWLEYLYMKHKDEILFDIRNIKNEESTDTSECDSDAKSIYDEDLSDNSDCDDSDCDDSCEEKKEDKTKDPSDMILNALRQPYTRLPPKRGTKKTGDVL